MRMTVRLGARVRCTTPLATLKPWLGSRVTVSRVLDVDQQPALEHEEELVLVVVLVPVEVAFDDPQAHDGVVDLGQRLVEPRLVRGGLGGDVDERAVGVLDVELDVVVAHEPIVAPRVRGG